MKKSIQIIHLVFIFLSFSGWSQVYVSEDFSSNVFPPDGWEISDQEANWSVAHSENAGGQTPELIFAKDPEFYGSSRLVFPALDLSENTSGMVILSFQHAVSRIQSFVTIGAAYRINDGEWISIWQQTVNSNILKQQKFLVLDGDFPTQAENIQFSLFFNGFSKNINYWAIDDILLYTPSENDLAIISIDVPVNLEEPTPITAVVSNRGYGDIFSFDLNWRINEGAIQKQSYHSLRFGLNETLEVSTHTTLPFEPGSYNLEVFISNVNGEPEDGDENNNLLATSYSVPSRFFNKKPLFESFTSSTCPPCYSFNTSFFNNFLNQNRGNLSIIKYQMNWPGSGDPYFNQDGSTRRGYYSVNSVPSLYINGKGITPSATAVNTAYNAALQEKSLFEILGIYKVERDNITIEASVLPYTSLSNVTIHVAVLENTTYNNASTNGETEFHNVMMKMLPAGNGTLHHFEEGEEYRVNHTFDMSGTFVEEMDDLSVVVFIQTNLDKNILQSKHLRETATGAPWVSSNISNNQQNVSVWEDIEIIFDQPIILNGSDKIPPEALLEFISFHETETPENEIDFNVSINEFTNRIFITPTSYLATDTEYTITVDPVWGYWDSASNVFTLDFSTRSPLGAPVASANPASGSENVPLFTQVEIHFDQQVRLEDGTPFEIDDLQQLVTLRQGSADGEIISFNGTLNQHNKGFTITPDEWFNASTQYFLIVNPVMGEDDELSEIFETSFSTRPSIGAPTIWTNIDENLNLVEPNQDFKIVFSQPVKMADGTEITMENINQVVKLFSGVGKMSPLNINISVNPGKNIVDFTLDENLDFNTPYTIEIDPLMGIEGDITEIIQVSFATRPSVGAPLAAFNIEDDSQDISIDQVLTVEFNQSVRLEDGSEITSETLPGIILFHENDLAGSMVPYSAEINPAKTIITVTPDQPLQYNQMYLLGVEKLLGTDNELSDEVEINFTTVNAVSVENTLFEKVKIFPNPAHDKLFIQLPVKEASVSIFDLSGKRLIDNLIINNEISIDISNLAEGIYYIEIKSQHNKTTEKLIIAR